MMNDKDAIAVAKRYVNEVFAEENLTNLSLEEVEHGAISGTWVITLGFSRPWNTPRTRAQEVLETLGAVAALKRSYKVITIAADGAIMSMKERQRPEFAE